MEKFTKALKHICRSIRNKHTIYGIQVEDSFGVEGVDSHPLARLANHPHVSGDIGAAHQVWVEVALKMVGVAEVDRWSIANLRRNIETRHIGTSSI